MPTKNTDYDWIIRNDLQDSTENLRVVGEQLDGISEQLETMAMNNELPVESSIDDVLEKIIEAKVVVGAAHEALMEKTRLCEAKLLEQETN